MTESIKLEVTATGKAGIDNTLHSLDELQQKLSGLGRNTGGMKSLQAELDRLREGFAGFKGAGNSSLQELEAYGKRLGSALDSISRVVSTKKISPQYAAQLTDFAQMIKLESEHTIRAIKEGSVKLSRAAAEAEVAKAAAVAKLRSATLAGGGQTGVASAIAGLFSQPQALPQTGVTALLSEIKAGTVAIGHAYEDRAAAVKATTPGLVSSYAQQGSAVVNQIRENSLAALVAQTRAADAAALAQREINRYVARPSPSNYARQDRVDSIFARAQAAGPADVNPQTLQASTAARTALNNAMQQGANHATLLGSAVKQLTIHHQDLNSSLRGLAQGFGVISAGLSNMVPLVTSFAVASAFVKTLKVGAEFERSMFVVSELAGTASAEMVGLRERVLQLGASTQYGPLEVAKGLEVLTLAGLTAKQAIMAVSTTLQFAAAGDLPLQSAAETLVAVGAAYRFSAESYSVVADVIAKTAAETMASVQAMAESFKTSSVVAQQYGVSLDDTAAALGALAQIGIKGTAAGTSFRNMVTELNKGSGKAAEGVKALGVEIQELDGSMRPVMNVMRDLTKAMVTRTGAGQQRILQDMTNERGAKALAAFQAEALNYIAKVNPGLQEQADKLFAAGKILAGNKLLTDAVTDAFAKMAEKAERVKDSAQGFTFFASLEQSLTPLGQYKGILASLETDFIKAFGASSDVVYILGARLREVFNSPEFQSGLTSLVSGIAAVASGMVSLTKWVVEHKEAVLLLAGAYLVLSTNVLRGLAMDAGAAALAVLTRGVLAMTTATVGLSAGAGLLATAKLAWASATVALTGTLAAAQIAAYNFWMALLAIPAAMVAIGVAIAAVVVGLGYLAYKWATAADSAEESAKKQRESLSESLKVAIEAGRLKNTSTAEQVATEIAEKEKLLTHLKNGLSQEEAANKAMGEMALVRIENTHREIMLHMALNAVKAKGAIFAMPGSDKHAAMSAEIDAASRAEILAQEKAMNSELAKQVTQTEKLRRINSEIAGWSRLKADQQRLVGKDDNIGYKGGNKPDFAKIKADKAEHDSAKGLIAEIKKEQQAAAKEIARYKAEAAQQTAAAAREEKREIAEITAAYLDGVEQRRVAAMEMESAVAAGSKSEVDGKNLLASLKLESNRAELAQIQAVMGASLKRYAEEFRAATLAHNLEKLRLEKSLSLQKQLAEQLKKKYGSDPSYAREIADAVGQVEVLQEQLKLWEVTTKEIDAASEKLLDTANKGTSDYTAKLREQDKALDEQLLASQRNVKSVQDELSNRAKGTAELRQEAAVKQAQHAFDMQAEADRLRMAGSESAVQAQKQADIARTAAAYLQLGITKDAAMSTDWYSATQKALKDYASSLENVAGEIANVFTKSFKGLEDVLTDFLTKGKADFKGFVKSILADLARIAVRQGIIGPMLGGFTSGMAGGGGGSMLGSLAGSAASSMMGGGASGGLLSGVGNTVGGWFGAGGGAAMAGANAAALSGAGTSLTGTLYTTAAMDSAAAYGAAGTSAGMASGGSMMGGISSAIGAIPVWGWALMAAAAIAAIAGKGETRSGGQYGYSTDGATVANARRGTTQSASGVGATFLEGPSGGTGDVAAVSLMNSAFKGINDLFKSLGSSETVSGFQSGYESSKNSRGGVFAGGTLASGKTFGESGKGDNYAGTLYEKTSAQTVSIEDAAKNYVTDLKQATVQAMQAATDLPKLIADKLKDLNAETMDDSALDALMGDIQNIIVSVNSFRDTLDTLPFTELRDMSFDAAAGLVQAVGGLDKLGTFTTNLSSYFDNFYSEEEKRKNTVKNITGTLNKAGLAVSEDQVNTATKETFRQVVEQYAAMGTEGQDVYLALLSVNQAFSDLSTATGSFLDDLKSYTESFSTKKELRSTAIKEITAKLNKNTSGVQVTDSMISSAGIKDFRAAVEATKAMGPAGRSAYESLLSVNQEFLALGNDQIKLDELLDTYGDLGSAADELVPPAEKLVDSWRNNKSAIQDLNDALDEALGTIKETTAAEKAVADVKKAVTNRDDLKEARKGINDTIDSIRLAAAKPADKVTLLKGKEAKLREEFAANPTATLFNKLTETTLARIKAEGELRQVNSDKEIAAQVKIDEMRLKSMQEQLSGFEALRDSAYELKQFVSDLKTGDLSALSPRDRLAEAKANFEETSRRAKAGDINAVNNLQGSAQTYLGVAKTNYGSATSQYASIFKDVTDNVTQIADYATGNASGTSAIDLQIEEAKKQVAALTTLASATVDTSKEEIAALTELGALADGAIEEMDKSILSLTEVAREQILLLQAVVDSQEIELKVQIEKHKELIAVLERIDENTDDTAATAVREASKV